jgi:hypothetical protein
MSSLFGKERHSLCLVLRPGQLPLRERFKTSKARYPNRSTYREGAEGVARDTRPSIGRVARACNRTGLIPRAKKERFGRRNHIGQRRSSLSALLHIRRGMD